MINKLALIHGEPVIPDGWARIYGKRFSKAEPVLLLSEILENDYYYHIREIRARWDHVSGEVPSVEIFRDLGTRAYQQGALGISAVDLQTITSPGQQIPAFGDAPAGPVILKPCIPLNMWFPPGSRLMMKVTGHLPGGNLDLVVHGRYYLDPEAV